jgi:hypothetical protein
MDWIHLAEARQIVGAHEHGKDPKFHNMQGIFVYVDNLLAGAISFARMTLLHGIIQLNFLSSASLWKDIKTIYEVGTPIQTIKATGLLHTFPVH